VKEEVKEELDPDHGGGTITTTSTFEAQALKLWTHPHDDCAPLDNLDLAEVHTDSGEEWVRGFAGKAQCSMEIVK
jgi:hypothetical protein